MNLMKYALNFICFKSLLRGMLDSRMLSFWFLHWIFKVVELQLLLGPLGFDIVSSGIHKTQAHSKVSYTIILSRRNVPVVRIELLYSTE